MSEDAAEQDRIRALKERRTRLAEAKENAEKRESVGNSIVEKVNAAFNMNLTLDQFDIDKKPPIAYVRRSDFKDSPGLVAAHTNEARAREILSCCDEIAGSHGGLISFDEYRYVGFASIESATFLQLLEAAKSLHDSVFFWPYGAESIVLVDHYEVHGVPRDVGFSIVIQGEKLEEKLASCFENVVELGSRQN